MAREGFSPAAYLLFLALAIVVFVVSLAWGSVNIPLAETFGIVRRALTGAAQTAEPANVSIILSARLPRVAAAALTGAALSLGGAAMQGLLKNPLADGTTLGVTGGASLGAAIAIAFGISIPGLPFAAPMAMSMVFAMISLLIVILLAYRLDYSLEANTVILLGVIFTMFASSATALIIAFAGEQTQRIVFWTLGSFAGARKADVLALAAALVLLGTPVLLSARELNAFAIGEDNARHIGVPVARVKKIILVCVSALIGVSVAAAGTIGFVGLVAPHMARLVIGPSHKKLLPASLFGGAIFLMLADLAARAVLSPRELPVGVITSLIGAIVFLAIFFRTRSRL